MFVATRFQPDHFFAHLGRCNSSVPSIYSTTNRLFRIVSVIYLSTICRACCVVFFFFCCVRLVFIACCCSVHSKSPIYFSRSPSMSVGRCGIHCLFRLGFYCSICTGYERLTKRFKKLSKHQMVFRLSVILLGLAFVYLSLDSSLSSVAQREEKLSCSVM